MDQCFPQPQLAEVCDSSKSPKVRLGAAQSLAKVAIHLHDGKDYIDDALPVLNAKLIDTSLSLELRAWLAVATVRMLAHGWMWEPQSFKEAVTVASHVLRRYRARDPLVSEEALHGAVLALQQICDPANDSDTEQEERQPGDDIKVIEEYFAPVAEGTDPAVADEPVSSVLLHVLEELMKSKKKGLNSAAGKLLSCVASSSKGKKRGRGDDVITVFLSNLSSLIASPTPDSSKQVPPILKGLNKILIEASFEARNDYCDKDARTLLSVVPHLQALTDTVQRVLTELPPTEGGKKRVDEAASQPITYGDAKYAGEERCPNKHWCIATVSLVLLRCIQASLSRRPTASESAPTPPVSDDELLVVAKAWNAHRFHSGSEFEEYEACVAHLVTDRRDLWCTAFSGAESGGQWICCRNPWEAKPQTSDDEGFSF